MGTELSQDHALPHWTPHPGQAPPCEGPWESTHGKDRRPQSATAAGAPGR